MNSRIDPMNEIHRLDLTQAVPPGVAGRQPKRHGSARLLRTIVLRGLWVILAALVLILATQPWPWTPNCFWPGHSWEFWR